MVASSSRHRYSQAMKSFPLILILSAGFCLFLGLRASVKSRVSDSPSVSILTYSSLGAKDGFLHSVEADFFKQTQCHLKIETTLGAAQMVSYLEEPKARARLDVVMGIDEQLFDLARSYLYLSPLPQPKMISEYQAAIQSRVKPGFYPIDFGAMTFIYQKQEMKKAGLTIPTRLEDLLKPEFKKKFILQDPRADSPGLLFFLFTDGILNIADLKKQWLTLAPGWDASYQLFLTHQAPLVWSYLTSLAYHESRHEADQYGYVDFQEGLPIQLEGMSVVDQVGNPLQANSCIEKWIHYVLSVQAQSKLAETQWMMPVLKGVTLPASFQVVPEVKKIARGNYTAAESAALLRRFGKEVQGAIW